MAKLAYVTGGMGGIGTAICRKFHDAGYKVIAGCGPTREWAYGRLFSSSGERREALPFWLTHYNFRRRPGSLGHRPPGSRLAELQEQPD